MRCLNEISFFQVIGLYVGEDNWNLKIYCVILLVPLIALGQIRNLKYLVPFSALANVLLLISLGIVMFYIFQDIPPADDKPLFTSFAKMPMFISTVIFAMEGIGVVMPVENEMKTPNHFLGCPGVLNIAMSVVIVLYTVIGLFGYLKYGEDLQPSITATLCNEYM
jgi:solute carrier family 36 (proton-coupled amino acid transporter)